MTNYYFEYGRCCYRTTPPIRRVGRGVGAESAERENAPRQGSH